MKAEKIIKEHMRKLGAKGGASKSKAKRLAAKKSIKKAREARWATKPGPKRNGGRK